MVGRQVVAVGQRVRRGLARLQRRHRRDPVGRIDGGAQHLVAARRRRHEEAVHMQVGGAVGGVCLVGLDRVVRAVRPRLGLERRPGHAKPVGAAEQLDIAVALVPRAGVVQRVLQCEREPAPDADAQHRRLGQRAVDEAEPRGLGIVPDIERDGGVAAGADHREFLEGGRLRAAFGDLGELPRRRGGIGEQVRVGRGADRGPDRVGLQRVRRQREQRHHERGGDGNGGLAKAHGSVPTLGRPICGPWRALPQRPPRRRRSLREDCMNPGAACRSRGCARNLWATAGSWRAGCRSSCRRRSTC